MVLALQVLGGLAAWCALSVPVGILVGRGLARGSDLPEQLPAPDAASRVPTAAATAAGLPTP